MHTLKIHTKMVWKPTLPFPPHCSLNDEHKVSAVSLLSIFRICRALCSNRGQTWTRPEMPWPPCAGRIPLRSCQASPLTSPPLPSEQRLLLSAVPRPGAACRMGYSFTLTVRYTVWLASFVLQSFCFLAFLFTYLFFAVQCFSQSIEVEKPLFFFFYFMRVTIIYWKWHQRW